MTVPILEEIMAGLDRVVDADIERSRRRLGKIQKGEKKLGEITSVETQKIWALADKYKGEWTRLRSKAEFESNSQDETDAFALEAARFDQLADLTREIFWVQARENISREGHNEECVGLRANFTMVRSIDRSNPMARFLGSFPLPQPPED